MHIWICQTLISWFIVKLLSFCLSWVSTIWQMCSLQIPTPSLWVFSALCSVFPLLERGILERIFWFVSSFLPTPTQGSYLSKNRKWMCWKEKLGSYEALFLFYFSLLYHFLFGILYSWPGRVIHIFNLQSGQCPSACSAIALLFLFIFSCESTAWLPSSRGQLF